ncbi:coiled-coil domain-containing protein [Ralstonia pseudosolanacearum]|uniref:hypothetical protein n=1 Tax=Ralstonia pseudosolanacearum TaxID=1310165 RepID=UPI0018D04793|nr:hypothetical protein [Ralstonia pseudosolanacearum]UWD91457.1 hypothetical protein NY025_10560 [Ralstonia pseudosolanacearum]CAH0441072.1 hypothetical protein LMG9673_01868 [Ralstonia pseudosolanacearum]
MGIVLTSLSVHGPDREIAEVTFHPKRRLIRGPSETGKSYIYDCLWYMLGGDDLPAAFPLAHGYQELRLRFTADDDEYEVRRGLSGGAAAVYWRALGNAEEEAFEPLDLDLGKLLVTLSGASGKQILRNHSKRGAVTGDDLRHWSLWSQSDIPAKQPSVGTGQAAPKHEASFHLFLTGTDDSGIQLRKSQTEAERARGELQAAEAALARIQTLMPANLKREEVAEALERVDTTLSAMTSQYNARASALKELRRQIADTSDGLRKVENDRNHAESMTGRFELLDKKYTNDLARLGGTSEGVAFFQELPAVNCPLCGASAESLVDPNDLRPAAPSRYRTAIAAEVEKIRALRVGLLAALQHERGRYQVFKASAEKLAGDLSALQSQEATVLQGARVEFTADPKSLALQRSELSAQLSNFDEIRHLTVEIGRLKKATVRKRITVTREGGMFGREVANRARALLDTWGFSSIENIALDDEACDLRIDDRSRLSYGAGVRGLYLSSLVVAFMEHALEKGHPHLGVVVLDSPLKTYADPDSTEEHEVPPATVVDRFYGWMSTWSGSGQIIVLENEPVMPDTAEALEPTTFTRVRGKGRYGFYPLRDGVSRHPKADEDETREEREAGDAAGNDMSD